MADNDFPYRPTARECAILLLMLVQRRNEELGKDLTRIRLAEITLKRLWGREVLREDFLRDVEDFLFRAGWALFYSGATFAAVKTTAVDGWPRLSSKRLVDDLQQVVQGKFNFSQHSALLLRNDAGEDDEE